MTETQLQQFENDLETFSASVEFFPYYSPEAINIVVDLARERVEQSGGYPSVSAFLISFEIAKRDGLIQPVRRPAPKPTPEETEPPELTAQEYRSMTARSIQLKYRNDATFRAQVDSLIERGLI